MLKCGKFLPNEHKKTGKLLTSRRYNHPPLLHSCPGGFSRSWPYKTCQGGKGIKNTVTRKSICKNFLKEKTTQYEWLDMKFYWCYDLANSPFKKSITFTSVAF